MEYCRLKIIVISIFILFLTSDILAQNDNIKRGKNIISFSLNSSIGYSDNDMNAFKREFSFLPEKLEFPAKVTDNFPKNPLIGLDFLLDFKNISCGIFYNFIPTGGRIAYSDYSGSYTLDTRISNSTFGFMFVGYILRDGYFDVGLNAKLGFSSTDLEVTETYNILNHMEKETGSQNYSHLNTDLGVRINFNYSIFKIGIDAGYLSEYANKTTISYSGARISLLLGIKYITKYGKIIEN